MMNKLVDRLDDLYSEVLIVCPDKSAFRRVPVNVDGKTICDYCGKPYDDHAWYVRLDV